MAAYWSTTGTTGSGVVRGRIYTFTTANTTNSTTATISDWYPSNCNYVSTLEPLPKALTDSLIALERMALLGINPLPMVPVRKPASVGGARAFRHLPRGKLDHWPSLNEKRMAWGLQ